MHVTVPSFSIKHPKDFGSISLDYYTAIDGLANKEIITEYEGIGYNSTIQFHIVLAETDLDAYTKINIDAKLIINVPRKWRKFTPVLANTTNFTIDEVKIHGDESTQIIGSLTTDLGELGTPEAATISFTAKAPDPPIDSLYPVYILADGVSTNAVTSFSIGPLSEIILQVDAFVPP